GGRAEGLGGHGDQLLALAQVGAVGDDVAVIGLDQPAEDDGGVETARIGQYHFLGGATHRLTPKRSITMAFWTWRRFSAWSSTMLCGPSSTASVISSPRWAGRQCITTACLGAHRSSVSLSWSRWKASSRPSRSASCPMLIHTSV